MQLPAHHPEIGPFLGVPLRYRDEAFGALYLARRAGAALFTRDELALVEMVAGHAAVAMEAAHLRVSLRARDEAVANLAHDFRGPLHSIALHEQLLLHQHGELVEAHMRTVVRAVDAMRRMNQSLVDIVSFDAGTLQLDLQTVDAAALVRDVVATEAPIAAQRGVALEVRAVEPETAPLDRERVWRVLANLVDNALKFTPPGGRVEVRAERSATELMLAVADTRPGIEPDVISHVFDRYYTATPGARGAGLGLHIVKSIVETHGGRVRANSEPGHGTVFIVSFPLHRT